MSHENRVTYFRLLQELLIARIQWKIKDHLKPNQRIVHSNVLLHSHANPSHEREIVGPARRDDIVDSVVEDCDRTRNPYDDKRLTCRKGKDSRRQHR